MVGNRGGTGGDCPGTRRTRELRALSRPVPGPAASAAARQPPAGGPAVRGSPALCRGSSVPAPAAPPQPGRERPRPLSALRKWLPAGHGRPPREVRRGEARRGVALARVPVPQVGARPWQ